MQLLLAVMIATLCLLGSASRLNIGQIQKHKHSQNNPGVAMDLDEEKRAAPVDPEVRLMCINIWQNKKKCLAQNGQCKFCRSWPLSGPGKNNLVCMEASEADRMIAEYGNIGFACVE
eukprot:CAMPEP_0169098858 /NCGR_PEP_ID=MMETSP1015-20121227/20260_1 /TAXON_ID=342587 /ORGANISM="Karlodinium micrum, Strain CCMP2283" /LENGTH=116 /DNA_ID=CAMNT_0009159725 /DNA_START=90 /DNA_END=440 /DNA_ORIENTATION=+